MHYIKHSIAFRCLCKFTYSSALLLCSRFCALVNRCNLWNTLPLSPRFFVCPSTSKIDKISYLDAITRRAGQKKSNFPFCCLRTFVEKSENTAALPPKIVLASSVFHFLSRTLRNVSCLVIFGSE